MARKYGLNEPISSITRLLGANGATACERFVKSDVLTVRDFVELSDTRRNVILRGNTPEERDMRRAARAAQKQLRAMHNK
jgi:hypothetical protein